VISFESSINPIESQPTDITQLLLNRALTGYPVEMIEDLDTDDFTALSEVIADFFPKGTASPPGDRSLPKPPTG